MFCTNCTVVFKDPVLLRYNSLPCGTECFTGCREELRPTSKKKRHLFLAVASGCRHVICPFVSTFLVGRRHFTVFGKYLLPFSCYISVQFYCYTSLFSLLANGRKLMAWPGVVFVVVVVNNFFQPLLLRNYCTDFFEIWYGASLGRGLSFFLIACFSTNQRRSHDQKHVFQKGVLVWMIT